MQIRRATHEDLTEIIQLFYDTVIIVNARDYNADQVKVWAAAANNPETWKKKVKEQLFVVAEKNRKILGFASLEDDGCLDMLYVHKDHQHEGVASALVGYLEDKARELQIDTLYSDVSITAQPFLQRRGYITERENRKLVKDVEFVNAIMRKNIR